MAKESRPGSIHDRRTALVVGVLFIVATAAVLVATGIEPALSRQGCLAAAAGSGDRVTLGVLLELLAAFASVAIAIFLYPLLQKASPGLAIGSVVFRAIEAVMYVAAAVELLSLLTLGQQLAGAEGAERPALLAVGASVLGAREHAIVAGVFAFDIGAFMYYAVLFRTRLIPRWLSGWGLVAIVPMFTACVLALFSDTPVTGYKLLALPIAVQELVLAVWLLVKGFALGPPSAGSSGRP